MPNYNVVRPDAFEAYLQQSVSRQIGNFWFETARLQSHNSVFRVPLCLWLFSRLVVSSSLRCELFTASKCNEIFSGKLSRWNGYPAFWKLVIVKQHQVLMYIPSVSQTATVSIIRGLRGILMFRKLSLLS